MGSHLLRPLRCGYRANFDETNVTTTLLAQICEALDCDLADAYQITEQEGDRDV